MKLDIRIVKNKEELEHAFQIRHVCFVQEQDCAKEEEWDGLDDTATHVIAYYEGKPIGCGRIRFLGDKAKLERMAVLSEFRDKGVGKKILEFMIAHSKNMGAKQALLHAQCQAMPFYKKSGFTSFGDEFMEAGIRHMKMLKELS